MPYEAGLGCVTEFLYREVGAADDQIGRVFLACAFGMAGLSGFELRCGGHGYISTEVRAYRHEKAYLAAVLNKKWVRLYIRKPALVWDSLDVPSVLHAFDDAVFVEHCGEIALNLSDFQRACDVMQWICSRLSLSAT